MKHENKTQHRRALSRRVKAYRERELPAIRAILSALLDRVVATAAANTEAARAANDPTRKHS